MADEMKTVALCYRWLIVNWTIKNKDQNTTLFVPENAFQMLVCEMAAIFSQPQCVKSLSMSDMLEPYVVL